MQLFLVIVLYTDFVSPSIENNKITRYHSFSPKNVDIVEARVIEKKLNLKSTENKEGMCSNTRSENKETKQQQMKLVWIVFVVVFLVVLLLLTTALILLLVFKNSLVKTTKNTK